MVAGAVLVGGRSTRMGHHKCDLRRDGRRWAEIALDALSAAGCQPVATVGAEWFAAVPGVPHVVDSNPGDGPLAALIDALGWAAPHDVVVLPTDLPWLTGDAVAPLVACTPGETALVSRHDRLALPCGRWSASTLEAAVATYERGGRSLHSLVERLEYQAVDLGAEFDDADTPEDLDGPIP